MSVEHRFEVHRVRDDAEFATLRDQWNHVAARMPPPQVFLFHEWFCAAWTWARTDSELHILQIRLGTETVGFCPLVLRTVAGTWPRLRRLEFLTVPDTQRSDLICSPNHYQDCLAAVASYLARRRFEWDSMDLRYLTGPPNTAESICQALRAHHLRAASFSFGMNPHIDLDNGWDSFYKTCSRRLKKANNLSASRLRRAGEIRVEWFRPGRDDAARVPEILDTITQISTRSWKGPTPFNLDQPGPRAFIRQLSDDAQRNGWLSIWILYLSDQPIAMEYQIIHGGIVHALRADFDESFRQYSPGAYLNWKLLETLFDANLERYYMGPGENSYKLRWTSAGDPMHTVHAFSPSLRGKTLSLWNLGLKPALRRLSRAVRAAGDEEPKQ